MSLEKLPELKKNHRAQAITPPLSNTKKILPPNVSCQDCQTSKSDRKTFILLIVTRQKDRKKSFCNLLNGFIYHRTPVNYLIMIQSIHWVKILVRISWFKTKKTYWNLYVIFMTLIIDWNNHTTVCLLNDKTIITLKWT